MPDVIGYLSRNIVYGDNLVCLLLAFTLGGLIGLERETKQKPVGFKTCVVISVTSCLLTLVSVKSALSYVDISDSIRVDPMRLAAQVISGVGFLGAGVILHRTNQVISGLTTAAIIWASAGIGIACGAGFYFLAVLATFLFLMAIKFSNFVTILSRKLSRFQRLSARITIIDRDAISKLLTDVKTKGYIIDNVSIMDERKGRVEVTLRLNVKKGVGIFLLYSDLRHIDYVYAVSLGH